MNILIPDSWLREFLKTKATPEKVKEYLSLCGPSVERVHRVGNLPANAAHRRSQAGEIVYDIEVTSNRPDMMSVAGIAREAAAILPRFGVAAKLVNDPYVSPLKENPLKVSRLKLKVKTDPSFNPRWTSVVFDNVTIGQSPDWLKKRLELVGVRPLNNVIDITNYLMHAYGQPAHVFDYDAIAGHTMTLRESRKGEKLRTLDGKTHTLPGGDIVISDGTGKLIDLAGIMGGENSSIKPTTRRVILFLQTYDPGHIRRTSMTLAHRTEASSLFEKGTDPELVWPVFLQGVKLMGELTGGKIASPVTDIYPHPYKKTTVSVTRQKVHSYIGTLLPDHEIRTILTSLGFETKLAKDAISVTIPSWRRDITIGVDIIEEIARIYGYHNISDRLPEGEPPVVFPNAQLGREEEVKVRLRDWGFTETYTYSMISESLMDTFCLDKTKAYKITNPLSEEWVYMRPTLFPSILSTMKENLNHRESLRLFELSMTYMYRAGDLPIETPVLIVAWTGHKFREAKGVAEKIFSLFGLDLPKPPTREPKLHDWDSERRLLLGEWAAVSEVNQELLTKLGIHAPVTLFWVHVNELVNHAKSRGTYTPIPRYPPVVEDLSFVVPNRFAVGTLIEALKKAHRLVSDVSLLDVHENTRTLHITYLDRNKNLTNEDIVPIREKLVALAESKFGVSLKT